MAYYVNKDKLKVEIQIYKDTDEITEKLGKMIKRIAEGVSHAHNFINYTYRDEFVSNSIYRCITQLNKIDLDHPKCNTFMYLTMICYNANKACINKHRRQEKIKASYSDSMFEHIEKEENINFEHMDKYE